MDIMTILLIWYFIIGALYSGTIMLIDHFGPTVNTLNDSETGAVVIVFGIITVGWPVMMYLRHKNSQL